MVAGPFGDSLALEQGQKADSAKPLFKREEGDFYQYGGLYLPEECKGSLDYSTYVENDKDTGRVFDGINAAGKRGGLEAQVHLYSGFYFVRPYRGSEEPYDVPDFGLKIHVHLDPADPQYADKLEKIARMCLAVDNGSQSTEFKMMTISSQLSIRGYGDDQGKKSVTIYPGREGQDDNITETIRLVRELGKILGPTTQADRDNPNNKIYGERLTPARGVFIRLGAITEAGREGEAVSKETDFDKTLEANLQRASEQRLIDADAARREIETAIKQGLL